jgi:predicted dehydrogenase
MTETIHYESSNGNRQEEVVNELLASANNAKPARKLGIALVGLGKYSTEQLAPALLETKHCYLAGIVTGSPDKVSEWQTKYTIADDNIYNYDNFDSIASNKSIDILYIVLPNSMHREFVIRGAKAGKHIICEKPMALTVEDCNAMIAACKDAGTLLSIGYRLHFDPYHRDAMKIGQSGVYGDLTYIHADHSSADTQGWRLDKRLAGGGPLMDLGIYCLQAAIYTSGMLPVAITTKDFRAGNDPDNDIEKSITWEMEFPNGLVALCESSYEVTKNILHGDAAHGWFELSPAYSYNGLKGKTATGFIEFPDINQQALQMDDFAQSILNNTAVTLPGEMGRRDMIIIEAIYESMKTGKRVALKFD